MNKEVCVILFNQHTFLFCTHFLYSDFTKAERSVKKYYFFAWCHFQAIPVLRFEWLCPSDSTCPNIKYGFSFVFGFCGSKHFTGKCGWQSVEEVAF